MADPQHLRHVRRDALPGSRIGLIVGVVLGVTAACVVLGAVVWYYLYLPNRDTGPDQDALENASTASIRSEHRGYAGMLHRLRRAGSPGPPRAFAEHTIKEKESTFAARLPPGAMPPALPACPPAPPSAPPVRPRMPRRFTSPTPPTLGTPIAPISEASPAPSSPIVPVTPVAPVAPDSAPMTPIMRPTSPEPPETPPKLPIMIRHADDSEDFAVELLPPLYRHEWAERRSPHLEEPAARIVRADAPLVPHAPVESTFAIAADGGTPLRPQVA